MSLNSYCLLVELLKESYTNSIASMIQIRRLFGVIFDFPTFTSDSAANCRTQKYEKIFSLPTNSIHSELQSFHRLTSVYAKIRFDSVSAFDLFRQMHRLELYAYFPNFYRLLRYCLIMIPTSNQSKDDAFQSSIHHQSMESKIDGYARLYRNVAVTSPQLFGALMQLKIESNLTKQLDFGDISKGGEPDSGSSKFVFDGDECKEEEEDEADGNEEEYVVNSKQMTMTRRTIPSILTKRKKKPKSTVIRFVGPPTVVNADRGMCSVCQLPMSCTDYHVKNGCAYRKGMKQQPTRVDDEKTNESIESSTIADIDNATKPSNDNGSTSNGNGFYWKCDVCRAMFNEARDLSWHYMQKHSKT